MIVKAKILPSSNEREFEKVHKSICCFSLASFEKKKLFFLKKIENHNFSVSSLVSNTEMSTTFSLAAQTIRQPLRATPKRRTLRMYGIQTDSRVSSSTSRRVAGNAQYSVQKRGSAAFGRTKSPPVCKRSEQKEK